jgi:hypothetical protein
LGELTPNLSTIEVVWSERICPVRSRVVNIPTGTTRFRYAESPESVQELERAYDNAGIKIEDWTANLENLCTACGEGRPHGGHDQELKEPATWASSRWIGFATLDLESLNGGLGQWDSKRGRSVAEMLCTLEAGAAERAAISFR